MFTAAASRRAVVQSGVRRAMPTRSFFGLPDQGVVGKEFLAFEEGKRAHAAKTMGLWKNIFFFTGIPVLLLCAANTYKIETEHFRHMAEHPPQFKDLPYLHVRNKPYPWKDGYKSLFHNEKTQPGPDSVSEQGHH